MQLKDFDFRLWHKPSKSFVEIKSALFDRAYYVPIDDESVEIELWSGFYDCKGKKIYENDIIQTTEEIGVVEYNRGTFWVRQENIEPYRLNVAIFEEFMNYGKVEVIGNIHENADS